MSHLNYNYGEKIPHDNYYLITSLLFLTFAQFLKGLEFNNDLSLPFGKQKNRPVEEA